MRRTNYISILTGTVSMNALRIKLSRTHSHNSSYSHMAVNHMDMRDNVGCGRGTRSHIAWGTAALSV